MIITSVCMFFLMFFCLSCVGALLVDKFIKKEVRIHHRMLMQPALTVAGMMFSVLLGFFIAESMKRFTDTNTNAMQEASCLGEVFRVSRGFDDPDRTRIRGLCRKYVDAVLNEEWQLLSEAKEGPQAHQLNQELWEAVLAVEPHDEKQMVLFNSLVDSMQDYGVHRRTRISTKAGGLAWHVWAIIATGASAIVTITYLFAPDSKAFHIAILSCLTIPIMLNAYLLAEFSEPFMGVLGGGFSVKPTSFQMLKDRTLTAPDTPSRFVRPHPAPAGSN